MGADFLRDARTQGGESNHVCRASYVDMPIGSLAFKEELFGFVLPVVGAENDESFRRKNRIAISLPLAEDMYHHAVAVDVGDT